MSTSMLALGVVLKLHDQFTLPMRRVTEGIGKLTESVSKSTSHLRALSSMMDSAAGNALIFSGGMERITGTGLTSYLRQAVGVEHRLAALGNTAGIAAGDLALIDARLDSAAVATNQFTQDLLSANEILIAAGMEWQTALDLTPILGKTATASQAAISDLALVGDALVQNLKVPVAEITRAFDQLVVSGESGKFELKDMAQYLPALSASMATLRFTGIENIPRLGAALQVARMGAGDSASAANNLQNFVNKLAAPEVQKNFAKFGLDLPAMIKDAQARNLDPFITVLDAVETATGGDELMLGQLFGDMQVQAFIKPMMLFRDEYLKMLGDIGAANGKIEQNFRNMMLTTAERWKAFQIRLSTVDMPWLNNIIDAVSATLEWMNAHPRIASWIANTTVAAGVMGLSLTVLSRIVSVTAGVIGTLGKASMWLGGTVMVRVAKEIANSGAPLRALRFHLAGVGRAFLWLGRMALMNPIGIALTAAALLIYKFWEPIAGFFRGVWAGMVDGLAPVGAAFKSTFAPLAPLFTPVVDVLSSIWRWLTDLLAPVKGTGDAAESMGRRFGLALAGVLEWPGRIIAAFVSLPGKMLSLGVDVAKGLAAGFAQGWEAIKSSIGETSQRIVDSVKGFFVIRSPSQRMAELGGMISAGLAFGIEDGENDVLGRMTRLASRVAAVPLAAGAMAFSSGAAFADSALTNGFAALETRAVEPIDRAAAMGGGMTLHIGEINVHAAPGQDAQAVAREVRRQLEQMVRDYQLARRGRLSD